MQWQLWLIQAGHPLPQPSRAWQAWCQLHTEWGHWEMLLVRLSPGEDDTGRPALEAVWCSGGSLLGLPTLKSCSSTF